MTAVRLGVMVVASPLEVGAVSAPALLEEARAAWLGGAFDGLELAVMERPVTDAAGAVEAGRTLYDRRIDALCVVAASWFEDYLVVDLLEECDVPVVAWARPGMETGSLCGMQQLGFLLGQIGRPFCFLFDAVDARPSLERAWDYVRAAALRRQLRRARIGLLGHRVEGMTETTAHELALKRLLGPRVASVDVAGFLAEVDAEPTDDLAERWRALAERVGRVCVSDDEGIAALRVHRVMRRAIQRVGLDALAVGCYPHLMGRVCLAASLLGEEGIPIACEGDVNGAVGMLTLTRLTGEPVHNTDLLDPIPEENAIVFSHCGSGGFTLAPRPADITLGPVRLMDQGLCCLFPARPGPVTLLNLVPTLAGYRMGALYGEALPTGMVFPGNPLKVRFAAGYREVLEWIVSRGLGHHWMAAYGDLRRPLRDLAGLTGCEWVEPGG